MDQVDQIIISTLKDIGIDIDDDVTSLKQFPTELVVRSVALCLNIINGDSALSLTLPEGMAGRYRVGIQLANACKAAGYKADIGYETFLYSADVEIRRALMFLVEALPRARQDQEDSGEPSSSSSLKASIASEIKRQLQLPWLPPGCHQNNLVWDGNKKTGSYHYVGGMEPFSSKSLHLSSNKNVPCLGLQCSPGQLLTSLLDLSSRLKLDNEVTDFNISSISQKNFTTKDVRELLREVDWKTSVDNAPVLETTALLSEGKAEGTVDATQNMFLVTEKLQYSEPNKTSGKVDENTEEEMKAKQEGEKTVLQTQLDALMVKVKNAENKISSANVRLTGLEADKTAKGDGLDKLKEEFALKKKTLALVPNEKDALGQIKETVTTVESSTKEAKVQWTAREASLQAELESLISVHRIKEMETSEHIEDVRQMRDEMATLIAGIEEKDEQLASLQQIVENLPSNTSNTSHTEKIYEIVARIKKQKDQVNQILRETKVVQKEINALNGKIERCFVATDEMIFRDAKTNDSCRKAYKMLAQLQLEFTTLIKALDDIGVINRELRDIEDLLQREKTKDIQTQLKKVAKDLKSVKKDNDGIVAAVKKARGK